MKHKAGEKFIIEIDRLEGNLYGIKGFNPRVFYDNELDRLEPVEEALNKARQEGAEDAWNFASKVVFLERNGGYLLDTLKEIFGCDEADIIMQENSYSETKAKIEEYERRKKEKEEKIQVGDIVEYPICDDYRVEIYVTEVVDNYFYGFSTDNGMIYSNRWVKDAKKTGKHKDLEEVLKGLRE